MLRPQPLSDPIVDLIRRMVAVEMRLALHFMQARLGVPLDLAALGLRLGCVGLHLCGDRLILLAGLHMGLLHGGSGCEVGVDVVPHDARVIGCGAE
jgi:hypothetical protein